MATLCSVCGVKLPMLRRLTLASLCGSCQSDQQRTRQAASLEYQQLLSELSAAPDKAAELQPVLRSVAERAHFGGDQLIALHYNAFESYLERTLEDDFLTVDEEAQIDGLLGVLKIDQAAFEKRFADWLPRLLVARCNDGRLPGVAAPRILLKKGEVAYMEANASLLKE